MSLEARYLSVHARRPESRAREWKATLTPVCTCLDTCAVGHVDRYLTWNGFLPIEIAWVAELVPMLYALLIAPSTIHASMTSITAANTSLDVIEQLGGFS
jgi:hypothetical protein